jgi:hypothetical protein
MPLSLHHRLRSGNCRAHQAVHVDAAMGQPRSRIN